MLSTYSGLQTEYKLKKGLINIFYEDKGECEYTSITTIVNWYSRILRQKFSINFISTRVLR